MVKKFILLSVFTVLLTSCANTAQTQLPPATTAPSNIAAEKETAAPPTLIPEKEPEYVPVAPFDVTSSASMTKVKSYSGSILSEEGDELTLYTSAFKENGKFVWDDSADWLLELKSSDGSYYVLYSGMVSNGNVYFDVVSFDEKNYILVREISTAADYTKVFCVKDGEICETTELDLNTLSQKDTNLLYSSVPFYR